MAETREGVVELALGREEEIGEVVGVGVGGIFDILSKRSVGMEFEISDFL